MAILRLESVGFLPSLQHSNDRHLSPQHRSRSPDQSSRSNADNSSSFRPEEAAATSGPGQKFSSFSQRRGSADGGDVADDWHSKLKHQDIALRARRLLGAKSFDDNLDTESFGGEILIDDDPCHPIFIRHDPLSEGFICSWVLRGESQKNSTSAPPEKRHWEFTSEFVRLPVGQGLKCVRFLRSNCLSSSESGVAATDGNAATDGDLTGDAFELPTMFAFLYEDYNHRSTVAVKRRAPASRAADSFDSKDSMVHISLADPKTALPTDVELDRPGGYLGRRACNVRVLDLFWPTACDCRLGATKAGRTAAGCICSSSTNWLVVITVTGLHVVEYGSAGAPKLVQSIKLGTVVHYWFERTKGYVLVEVRPVSRLQPFKFHKGKLEQLPDVHLQLLPWQRISAQSIYLMALYDDVFCIHCDSANGRLTLKAVSRPSKTEYVAVVFGPGTMILQKRENLLLLHRPDRAETWVYDVRHVPSLLPSYEEDGYRIVQVAELGPPLRLTRKGTLVLQSVRALDDAQYPTACSFDASVDGWVIDRSNSVVEVCLATLDLRAATSILLPRPMFTNKQMVQTLLWLLRRRHHHARAELVEVVTAAAAAVARSTSAEPWISAMDVCTGAMRFAAAKQRNCSRQQWLNNIDQACVTSGTQHPLLVERDIIGIIEARPSEMQLSLTLAFLERLLNRRLLPGPHLRVLLRRQCSKPLLQMLVNARLLPSIERRSPSTLHQPLHSTARPTEASLAQ